MVVKDKNVLVFGSGISGEAACELLLKEEAKVVLYDGNDKLNPEEIRAKIEGGDSESLEIVLGTLEGDRKEELSFRCLFAESMDKEADGVCMAWTEAGTDGSLIPSLHWLAVLDAKKGQGIGTALVREALRVFAGRGEVPVFLHTQPWSYEAVGLYLKAGFFLCRSETFGTHKNQFQEGIRILEQYLEVDPRLCR